MKQIFCLFCVVPSFWLYGCKKQAASPLSASGNSRHSERNSHSANDKFVRMAAENHDLPPNIRQGAAIFTQILDGVKTEPEEFEKAAREMASIRNEQTCRIWISMLRESEARLPEVFPRLEEFARLEKKQQDGDLKGIESNPLRHLDVLTHCLTYLTQFEMTEADHEVSGFLSRFETKYGDSEAGKHFLSYYRSEIENAMVDRKSGAVLWKQDNSSHDE